MIRSLCDTTYNFCTSRFIPRGESSTPDTSIPDREQSNKDSQSLVIFDPIVRQGGIFQRNYLKLRCSLRLHTVSSETPIHHAS